MPNALWEPIIGSSFDALAGQRANWAGFNANMDQANISRLNQSEQSHNQWLSRLQQIQEAEASRAEQQAREEEQARQFDVSAGIGQDQNRIRYASENARTDAINKQTEAQGIKDRRAIESSDAIAKSLAPDLQEHYSSLDTAQQNFNNADRALQTRQTELMAKADPGRIKYDGKSKLFVATNPEDTEAMKMAAGNNLSLANAKADYDEAKTKWDFHQKRVNSFLQRVPKGLTVVRQGDKWAILNSATGKTYTPPGKTPEPGWMFTSGSTEWQRPILPAGPAAPQFGAFGANAAPATTTQTAPAPSTWPQLKSQAEINDALKQANEAIAAGKDPDMVRQRLRAMGINVQ